MLIAIPTQAPGGLDASVSEHFGHADGFTLVQVEDGKIGEVTVVENSGHAQGGCMAPVMLLEDKDVEVLVAGGMGARPLTGLQRVGIKVHFKEEAETAQQVLDLFLEGKCREFGEEELCGDSHCGGHGHAHPAPVEREPIEGKADIQKDRVISFDFELKDGEGNLIDSSKRGGPMQYLHGHGGILAPLEKALEGHEVGEHLVVEIPRAEGFGDRDDQKILEVPRADVPENCSVGDLLAARDEQGRSFGYTVLELTDDVARLDGNHPLAGKDLTFTVDVVKVEKATEEEIQHGHAH